MPISTKVKDNKIIYAPPIKEKVSKKESKKIKKLEEDIEASLDEEVQL